MKNFTTLIPTQLKFGKDVEQSIGEDVKAVGSKTLLLYGKGSVVKNGYYDRIKSLLEAAKVDIIEYSGIKPNPIIEDVEEAAELCRQEQVNSIVALGGGSVLDSAKVISLANHLPAGKAWQMMKREVEVTASTPIFSVLTLAATGSETNSGAVVQNHEVQEKIGFLHPAQYPHTAYLNPEFTKTVPHNQTVNGLVDTVVHCFEALLGEKSSPLGDKFALAIIQEIMEISDELLQNPNDYELRARKMWASTNALNGLTMHGRVAGDWGTHGLGHFLSLLFDIPHAQSLSIVLPALLKVKEQEMHDKIIQFGATLFGTSDTKKAIEALTKWLQSVGTPVSLTEVGLTEADKESFKKLIIEKKAQGYIHKLSDEERTQIADLCL